VELKLWRATEAGVRAAFKKDLEAHGTSSRFVQVGEYEFAFREWITKDA